LHLIFKAFCDAFEALPILLFTLSVIILVFSACIYMVEPRHNIGSLPQAMWFTIVTMSTVGYGDVSPSSMAGYLITAVLIALSVLYMAMPIGIVGQTFGDVWRERDRILLMQQTRKRLTQWGYTAEDIPIIFHLFDEDSGGEIELPEFQKMIAEMGIGLTDERIVELFESLDTDGGGGIDDREFVKHVFPQAFHKLYKVDTEAIAHFKAMEMPGKPRISTVYVPRSNQPVTEDALDTAATRLRLPSVHANIAKDPGAMPPAARKSLAAMSPAARKSFQVRLIKRHSGKSGSICSSESMYSLQHRSNTVDTTVSFASSRTCSKGTSETAADSAFLPVAPSAPNQHFVPSPPQMESDVTVDDVHEDMPGLVPQIPTKSSLSPEETAISPKPTM
jgi:hypothetical protein